MTEDEEARAPLWMLSNHVGLPLSGMLSKSQMDQIPDFYFCTVCDINAQDRLFQRYSKLSDILAKAKYKTFYR